MEKTYYLVHILFGDNSQNSYVVYEYKKSRRFTAGQAWRYIYSDQKKIYAAGVLSRDANIFDYFDIVKKLDLNLKVCDRYCTFGFIK